MDTRIKLVATLFQIQDPAKLLFRVQVTALLINPLTRFQAQLVGTSESILNAGLPILDAESPYSLFSMPALRFYMS